MTTAARTKTLYKAAPGAGFNDREAQRYGSFLERKVGLGKRPVPPEEIVEAAKPLNSPIHSAFEWRDDVAADRYRIEQARHLVQHIVLDVEIDDGGESTTVRAFHSVVVSNGETTRGYIAEKVVWRNQEFSEQVVERALGELRGWAGRYRAYAQLAHVVSRIDEILEEAA